MSHVGVSGSAGVSRPSNSTGQRRTLSGLSDRELLSRVKDLVSRERAVTLEILVHLNEVERRRLHLGLGYPSMFEYAVRHLGYSASAAARRIRAARCIRSYPEFRRFLEKNEVNLVTISMVASILTNGERQGTPREGPGEVATGGGSDRGDVPSPGIHERPGDAGVCGGPRTELPATR